MWVGGCEGGRTRGCESGRGITNNLQFLIFSMRDVEVWGGPSTRGVEGEGKGDSSATAGLSDTSCSSLSTRSWTATREGGREGGKKGMA